MFYRQSIIVFCLVVPAAVCALLLGIGFIGLGNLSQSFELKKQKSANNKMSEASKKTLGKQVGQERGHYLRWKQSLSEETASTVATTLRDIMEKLPNKEIQLTAREEPKTIGGFGAVTQQSSSVLRISFRGTYRTLQKALLELETTLPQLQLQDLKIDPVGGPSNLINMQVTYTAWELDKT